NFNIVNKAKGITWLKISTKGETAHGAYPWRGTNAIWKMHAFLNKLQKLYPVPKTQEWVTTVNLSRIDTSNLAFNKIPDYCEVCLDIRYIARDTETIIDSIKQILPSDFTITIVAKEPSLYVKEDNPFIQKL